MKILCEELEFYNNSRSDVKKISILTVMSSHSEYVRILLNIISVYSYDGKKYYLGNEVEFINKECVKYKLIEY